MPKFAAVRNDHPIFRWAVKQGLLTVALCYTRTMANRIANALNVYTPDRRGQ